MAEGFTHRVVAPTAALAQALVDIISEEGWPATVAADGSVLAHCPGELLSNACHVLSFGNAKTSASYRRSHYARAAWQEQA